MNIIPNEENATISLSEFGPNIIIVDRPNTRSINLDRLFGQVEYTLTVIIIGWDDDRIITYSRRLLGTATVEKLINVAKRLFDAYLITSAVLLLPTIKSTPSKDMYNFRILSIVF